MKIVTNHWGWSLAGIWSWLRFGWAWPVETWGIEVSGSLPRRYARRVKVGPMCFGFGLEPSEPQHAPPAKAQVWRPRLFDRTRSSQ